VVAGLSAEQALEYIRTTAPDDVIDAITWLIEEGWRLDRTTGGPTESFGNLQAEFEHLGNRIWVIRDRNQWMLNLRPHGHRQFDLDVVLDAMAGRADWSGPHAVREQLPPDVSWQEAIPRAIGWIESTEDADAILTDTRRRRRQSLFPSTREVGQ